MGQVIYLEGAAISAGRIAAPMRQPVIRGGGGPVSHFVSIGEAVCNLLDRLMRESVITKP